MYQLRRREGFALLAVLWMLTSVAALGLLLVITSRDAVGVATNRANVTRAAWLAEGCVERARAAVEEGRSTSVITDSLWHDLDVAIATSPLTAGCNLSIVPAGITLDVNSADREQIRRLLYTAGVPVQQADSLADAVLDWRDEDDEPRVAGVERDWYEARDLVPPRNAPLTSAAELAHVHGIEALPAFASLLGVEPGRILLGRAPLPVLAALPGFGPEALAVVAAHRMEHGDEALDLTSLAALLSDEGRSVLLGDRAALGGLLTSLPDAWIITSAVKAGTPEVEARISVRVVRSGSRLAILRRQSWP